MLKVKVDSDGERGDMDMIIMVELLCIHDSILTAQRCSAVLSDLQNQWITHTHKHKQGETSKEETNERTDCQFKTRRITSVAVLLAIIVLLAISR